MQCWCCHSRQRRIARYTRLVLFPAYCSRSRCLGSTHRETLRNVGEGRQLRGDYVSRYGCRMNSVLDPANPTRFPRSSPVDVLNLGRRVRGLETDQTCLRPQCVLPGLTNGTQRLLGVVRKQLQFGDKFRHRVPPTLQFVSFEPVSVIHFWRHAEPLRLVAPEKHANGTRSLHDSPPPLTLSDVSSFLLLTPRKAQSANLQQTEPPIQLDSAVWAVYSRLTSFRNPTFVTIATCALLLPLPNPIDTLISLFALTHPIAPSSSSRANYSLEYRRLIRCCRSSRACNNPLFLPRDTGPRPAPSPSLGLI